MMHASSHTRACAWASCCVGNTAEQGGAVRAKCFRQRDGLRPGTEAQASSTTTAHVADASIACDTSPPATKAACDRLADCTAASAAALARATGSSGTATATAAPSRFTAIAHTICVTIAVFDASSE